MSEVEPLSLDAEVTAQPTTETSTVAYGHPSKPARPAIHLLKPLEMAAAMAVLSAAVAVREDSQRTQ